MELSTLERVILREALNSRTQEKMRRVALKASVPQGLNSVYHVLRKCYVMMRISDSSYDEETKLSFLS